MGQQTINHFITYSVISSQPELSYSSVVSTIRCYPITSGEFEGSTFVEWTGNVSGAIKVLLWKSSTLTNGRSSPLTPTPVSSRMPVSAMPLNRYNTISWLTFLPCRVQAPRGSRRSGQGRCEEISSDCNDINARYINLTRIHGQCDKTLWRKEIVEIPKSPAEIRAIEWKCRHYAREDPASRAA